MDRASLAKRMAQGLDGDAVETPHGWYVRRELRPVYLPLDRERLADLPGMPARRHSPALPRHRDDGPRQRRRNGGIPGRHRLVAGRPSAAPAAPSAGSLGRRSASRRPCRRRPARGLARHLQRPDLRLAAPRDALPHGSAAATIHLRAPGPAPPRAAPLPPPPARRPPPDGGTAPPPPPPRPRHPIVGDPGRLPLVPPRRAGRSDPSRGPPQRGGRRYSRPNPGAPGARLRRRARFAAGPRPGISCGWPASSATKAASTRR